MIFYVVRGVDNWHGYGMPPDREDYETEEEYEEARDSAIDGW